MLSRSRLSFAMAFALVVPTGIGCRGEQPYGVVEGVVTLGGQPLAGAEVVFMPDPERGTGGRRSVALTDKEGRYRIASDAGRAGAPVGVHRVCINDLHACPPGVAPASYSKRLRFPDAYATATRTPFRDVEVREGIQVINFDLKRDLSR